MSSIGGIYSNPKLLISHVLSAAINNLTKGLALEVAGDGILVNAIALGAIQTDNWALNMVPKVRETRSDLAKLSDKELIKQPGWCSSVAVPCRCSLCFQLTPGTKTEVPI